MAHELYEHKTDRGHRDDCKFTHISGPSCNCEQEPAYNILRAMELLGWDLDERDDGIEFSSYQRSFGEHIVTVAHCKSGWQLRWEKGGTFTYLESRSFGTIGALLTWFWGSRAEEMDMMSRITWEYGARTQQLKDAGIEPRELGKKPKPAPPAEPGPLKHEVTAMMDNRKET